MQKRNVLWASLIIIAFVTQPNCISLGTFQAYPDKKLPDKQTALIKNGNNIDYWTIDGDRIPDEQFNILMVGGSWDRKAIRVLPGEHEIGAGWPTTNLTFVAEAGQTYTFFWKKVGEIYKVWKGEELGVVEEGEENFYVWLKDESGTVIAGEKPPEDSK